MRNSNNRMFSLIFILLMTLLMISYGFAYAAESENHQNDNGDYITDIKTQADDQSNVLADDPSDVQTEEESFSTEADHYQNSISGTLWLDENGNGFFDSNETAVSNYPVYLYKATDTEKEIRATATNDAGLYEFDKLEPDHYIVGIKAKENGSDYLLPIGGIVGDNKFEIDTVTETKALTKNIAISLDMQAANINGGMTITPQAEPQATPQTESQAVPQAAPQITPRITSRSTTVDDGAGIIVYTEDEFIIALADSSYSTIYFGDNITMTRRFNNVVKRTNGLTINGTNPNTGATFTYKDCNSLDYTYVLSGAENNITFKNMILYIQNYFGIYRHASGDFNVTLDHVEGRASQYFYAPTLRVGTLTIKDSDLQLDGSTEGELAERAGEVIFAGNVTVERIARTTFSFFNYVETVTVADGANVRLTQGPNDFYTFFYYTNHLVVGEGAALEMYSPAGFCYSALTSIIINKDADVKFIYTGASSHAERNLYADSITLEENASCLLYDNQTGSYGALRVATLKLNHPKQFVVLNKSYNAISSTSTVTLNATGIGEIGYFYNNKISSVYHSTEYEYIGTEENYSKWWVQNQAFHVEARAWSGTNPSITSTTYTADNVLETATSVLPETTLTGGTAGNFALNKSGQAAYGVVVKGYVNPPKDIVYNITYQLDEGVNDPENPGSYTAGVGVASFANASKEGYSFAGWYDAETDGNQITQISDQQTGDVTLYARWTAILPEISYSITEKYVDSNGKAIEGVADTITTISAAPYDYSNPFVPQTITASNGIRYIYVGYRFESYISGDMHITGNPQKTNINCDETVYLIYSLANANLSINKIVTGRYSDPNKEFEITITLLDGQTPVSDIYNYTESSESGTTTSSNGSIEFDTSGRGKIKLKHGKTITLSIPNGYTYTVTETDSLITNGIYTVIYSGDGSISINNITGTLGADGAAVSITNDRSTVVVSGMKDDNYQLKAAAFVTILATGLLLIWCNRRRKGTK